MTGQGSHSETPSDGGKGNRHVRIALIVAGVLALVYVAFIHYLDSKNRLIFKGACTKQDSYILSFKRSRQKKEKILDPEPSSGQDPDRN